MRARRPRSGKTQCTVVGRTLAEAVGIGRRDGGAHHRAFLAVVPRPAAMEHGAVVPHHHVALPPLVDVDELAPRRLVQQLGQQLAGVAVVHAVDRVGVARDIERAPVVGRVAPVHAPAHRRQRLALLGVGEVGMDLVAAVGIGVRRHGVLEPAPAGRPAGAPRRAASR